MGKKKKKEKKKKIEDNTEELDKTPAYSLDAALHSTKNTETTLQSLMREVSEEKGIVKKAEDEKIRPQLSHENRSEIAEAYALEDVPIAQRKQTEKRKRTALVSESTEKASEKASKKAKPSKPPVKKPKIQVEVSTISTPGEEEIVEPKEDIAPTPPTKETPVLKKDNIYLKLTEFFEDLLGGYNARYERWENSISNILAIMRKMRKITKKNTDDLVISIQNLYKKIQAELELFKVKRNEVEKVAEVDIESMSGEFKRVLGLLELQVKEYQLKRVTDELIHEIRY
ncbi:MAG: hypothetical protein ACW972_02320 [Promethearchaeota archaeon]|jgi:hypothetical protein